MKKIVSTGLLAGALLVVPAVRRPIIVLRTDEALKMRSNKIDGSYEIRQELKSDRG
jgi:hypothetical protein